MAATSKTTLAQTHDTKDLQFTPCRHVLVSDWLSFSTKGRRGAARAGVKGNGNPLSQSACSRSCLMLIDAVAAGTPLLGCHAADSQSISLSQTHTHITEVSYGSFFCGSTAVTAEKLLQSFTGTRIHKTLINTQVHCSLRESRRVGDYTILSTVSTADKKRYRCKRLMRAMPREVRIHARYRPAVTLLF